MSLFRGRELWTADCGGDGGEEFDRNCIAVGNLDNASPCTDKVIVGSFSGSLRVFLPSRAGWDVNDLLMESHLGLPILQVAIGPFASTVDGLTVAILHPRRLSVYEFVSNLGADRNVQHMQMNELWSHNLERSSYNFCTGSFGGESRSATGQNTYQIAVQSLDGQLQFFEESRATFARFIPQFLVAGPLTYVPQADEFITVNSTFEVQGFKYHSIAASEDSKQQQAAQTAASKLTTTKRLQPTWSIDIGESAVDVWAARVSRAEGASYEIIVLGEHTLFVVRPEGSIRVQKKLQYSPLTSFTYPVVRNPGGSDIHNIVVASMEGTMYVYSDSSLVWAAKLPEPPVAMRLATVQDLKGVIMTLSDIGKLHGLYLGTDPPSSAPSASDADPDYAKMDAEHQRLLGVIRDATSESRPEPESLLNISTQIAEPDNHSCNGSLTLEWPGEGRVRSVEVVLELPKSVTAMPDKFSVSTVMAEPEILTFKLEVDPSSSLLVGDSVMTITALYTTMSGQTLSSRKTVSLPLGLFVTRANPQKDAKFKTTLEFNQDLPPLPNVFGDIQGSVSSENGVGLRLVTNEIVSILVGKSAKRKVRVQGSSMGTVAIGLQGLVERCSAMEAGGTLQSPLVIALSDASVPLAEYVAAVDAHWAARQQVKNAENLLADRAAQTRAVEKRLLAKLKDRNPVPLGGLDILMKETHQDTIAAISELQAAQNCLEQCGMELSASTVTLRLLIKWKFELTKRDYDSLCRHWPSAVSSATENGWEETILASLTVFLKTTLAKTASSGSDLPAAPSEMHDTNKLKKAMAAVCERLDMGIKFRHE